MILGVLLALRMVVILDFQEVSNHLQLCRQRFLVCSRAPESTNDFLHRLHRVVDELTGDIVNSTQQFLGVLRDVPHQLQEACAANAILLVGNVGLVTVEQIAA